MLCCPHCSVLSTILLSIVTPDFGLDSGSTTCSILLTTLNVGSTTLFNPVLNNLQQLLIFCRVVHKNKRHEATEAAAAPVAKTVRGQQIEKIALLS